MSENLSSKNSVRTEYIITSLLKETKEKQLLFLNTYFSRLTEKDVNHLIRYHYFVTWKLKKCDQLTLEFEGTLYPFRPAEFLTFGISTLPRHMVIACASKHENFHWLIENNLKFLGRLQLLEDQDLVKVLTNKDLLKSLFPLETKVHHINFLLYSSERLNRQIIYKS